jgi:HPt (histidine-containing phosphotransfer) domain-containing protein
MMSEDLMAQQSWRDQMSARVGGSPAGLIAVCDAFLLEVPDLMARIHQAVADQDVSGLKRAAHTLKSCLSYVAVPEDVEIAEAIEADSNRPESISAERLETADVVCRRWIKCVQTLRDETSQRLP